jgi:hypothetical protein
MGAAISIAGQLRPDFPSAEDSRLSAVQFAPGSFRESLESVAGPGSQNRLFKSVKSTAQQFADSALVKRNNRPTSSLDREIAYGPLDRAIASGSPIHYSR